MGIRKQDLHTCCLKRWKKIFHANRNFEKAGLAILISDKTDFKTKGAVTDKEEHYIMITGTVQQEDIILVNSYNKVSIWSNPVSDAKDFLNQELRKDKLHRRSCVRVIA